MERYAVAAAASPNAMHIGFAHSISKTRMQCSECKERFEAGKGSCYCHELHRRKAYDLERARKGLAALYRPPSMR